MEIDLLRKGRRVPMQRDFAHGSLLRFPQPLRPTAGHRCLADHTRISLCPRFPCRLLAGDAGREAGPAASFDDVYDECDLRLA